VYGVDKDSNSAFVLAFGYVLGAGVRRAGFRGAANSRRAVPSKYLDGMGSIKTDLRRIKISREISAIFKNWVNRVLAASCVVGNGITSALLPR
jgi:hypothetical protein